MQSFSSIQTNKISIGKSLSKSSEAFSVKGETKFEGSVLIDSILKTSEKICIGKGTPKVSLEVFNKDAIKLPVGNSRQRPNTRNTKDSIGYIRYNTDIGDFEGFGKDNTWNRLGGINENTATLSAESVFKNIDITGNLILKDKLCSKQAEFTSLTPNLALTYPGMITKEMTPNYTNFIYTSPSGSLNINPSVNNTTGNVLNLLYNKGGGSSCAYEYVSRIRMVGQNDGSIKGENSARYGEIATQIIDATDNNESSNMEFAVMNSGTLTDMIILCGKGYNNTKSSYIKMDSNILCSHDFKCIDNDKSLLHWDNTQSLLTVCGKKDRDSFILERGNLTVNDNQNINGKLSIKGSLNKKWDDNLEYETEIIRDNHSEHGIKMLENLEIMLYNEKNTEIKKNNYAIVSRGTENKITDIIRNSAEIDYINIISILTSSVKKLQTQVTDLSKEIDNLKSKYSK